MRLFPLIFTSFISVTRQPLRIVYTPVSTRSPPICSAIWSPPPLIHLPETSWEKSPVVSSLNVRKFFSLHLALPFAAFHSAYFFALFKCLLICLWQHHFLGGFLIGCRHSPFTFPLFFFENLDLQTCHCHILCTSHGFNNLKILVTAKSVFLAWISSLNLKTGHFHINISVASLSACPNLTFSTALPCSHCHLPATLLSALPQGRPRHLPNKPGRYKTFLNVPGPAFLIQSFIIFV